ncbi:hypothetical protein G5B40_05290 [Pikeienuella piscinae]|uniref:Putative manganese efflux pump MntP n=1 Tax=Pikeienuella piscinae TaxID=2748098 RepID=A0A7L5BYE4_9RHOB|nr:manganese efflux pump [Pikeienuella piscinae]QIE54914.1 hypothetical protein G5B40_05290 [Pikeienuella piscinae]
MSAPALVLIAIGLSVDAMVAALGRGAGLARPRPAAALRIGLVFAAAEAGFALLGWSIGHVAGDALAAVDHWIAFGLLGFVGFRMMRGAGGGAVVANGAGALALTAVALGSGVDALAVGGSLALVEAPILPLAGAVAAATFLMSAAGVMLAGRLGPRFGVGAERAGGALLVALGLSILVSHLFG